MIVKEADVRERSVPSPAALTSPSVNATRRPLRVTLPMAAMVPVLAPFMKLVCSSIVAMTS